jgi:flavin reductase (DIM6/NTAB) family NADH-FMN oxidoreductase RutF
MRAPTLLWQLLSPHPVVMISTKDLSGSTRCSPFSWIVPLNKVDTFGVMMRVTSQTLQNLKRDPYFTLSWPKASAAMAHTILLSSHHGPDFPSMILVGADDVEYDYPEDSVAVANCGVHRIHLLPALAQSSHLLVICIVKSLRIIEEGFTPLLHFGQKTFATPLKFDVEGY